MDNFLGKEDALRTLQKAFHLHFQSGPSSHESRPGTNDHDDGSIPIKSCKCRCAITDAEQKALWDYYFNHEDGKPPQKVIHTWFFQEFRHLPS